MDERDLYYDNNKICEIAHELLLKVEEEADRARELWGDYDSKNTTNDWLAYICRYASEAVGKEYHSDVFRDKMIKCAGLCLNALVQNEIATIAINEESKHEISSNWR